MKEIVHCQRTFLAGCEFAERQNRSVHFQRVTFHEIPPSNFCKHVTYSYDPSYMPNLPYPQRRRWSRGSVLAFGTEVRGFKLGRSRRIFQGEKKILSTPSFGKEVKPFVPCRRFAACKRSLNVTWKSGIFRQNSSAISLPSSSSFHY